MAWTQVCRVNPGEKGKYIKIILSLLQSTSTAVVYECAVTLVGLSQAPTAIRAAANCYCQLLVSQSDNNVKLIVLDRLQVSSLQQHAGVAVANHYCVTQLMKGSYLIQHVGLLVWKVSSTSLLACICWQAYMTYLGVSFMYCMPRLSQLHTTPGFSSSHDALLAVPSW